MNPHLFAPSVLALAAALGALSFANVVTQGFSSEGCRFGSDGPRWSAAGEYLLVHGLLFGLPTAIIVLLLYRLIAGRLSGAGASFAAPRTMAGCIAAAFVTSMLASLHFVANCGARTGALAILTPVATTFRFLAPILALFGVVALLVGFFQALGRGRS